MDKNSPLPSRYYALLYLFVLSILFPGYGQNTSGSIALRYKELEGSDIEYSCKIEKLNQLLETKEAHLDSIQLGYRYNDLSKFNYRHRDFENAILNVQKALVIQKKFIDSIPSSVNRSYHNLALFYLRSDNETKALETFKTLTEQSYKDRYIINAYTVGLADLHKDRGDYYKAISYLQEAENTIKKANDSILKKELYHVYLGFSSVYSNTLKNEHYKKAITYLKKAEASITHLSPKRQLENKIIIYYRYGSIYSKQKRYQKAFENHKKALDLGLKATPINKSDIASSYNNLGISSFRLNKITLAKEYYAKAIQHDSLLTAVYNNLGDIYLTQQNYEESLLNYQKAISYKLKEYQNIDYTALPTIEKLAQSSQKVNLVNNLKDKANGWFAFYSATKNKEFLQHALATIKLADKLIDIIRSESTELQSKYFWREKGVDLYMLATSICYELNAPEQAFYFMEKSKSLSLLENLTHEDAKNRANLPDSIIEKEYTLKHNIHKIKVKLKDDNTLTELEKQSLIFEQKKAYDNFINSLEKQYPGYYNYKKVINIASLQESRSKIVSPTRNILQYILTKNKGYGILISYNSTHFFKIPDVELLHEQIRILGQYITEPLITNQQQSAYVKTSFSVFKKLFPFDNAAELLSSKNLLIIPDYTLQYFPFEALAISSSTQKNKIPYFIYATEISYAYSISLLKKIEAKNRNPQSYLIGYAPINFNKHGLATLTRSESKLKEINNHFSSSILLNENATKSNFIVQARAYNIIHLSTHASSENDQEPWIAFYDNFLTLNEIYFIKNQADLVVLDACKSGIGKLHTGEGVMSLSRGFFHSGAKSVISSLWNTNEKSNTSIILDFYSFLKKGESKSTALHKAKLKYLEENQFSESSPYFWAPLILIGSIKNTIPSSTNTTYIYIGFLLLIIVLIVIYFRKKPL